MLFVPRVAAFDAANYSAAVSEKTREADVHTGMRWARLVELYEQQVIIQRELSALNANRT